MNPPILPKRRFSTETATYACKCCRKPFTARVVDRKRGWARFCSKSCKAVEQTRRTGRGRPTTPWAFPEVYDDYRRHHDDTHPFSEDALQP